MKMILECYKNLGKAALGMVCQTDEKDHEALGLGIFGTDGVAACGGGVGACMERADGGQRVGHQQAVGGDSL